MTPDAPAALPAGSTWLEARLGPLAHRIADAPLTRALREALPAAFVVLLAALAVLVLAVETGGWATRLRAAIPDAFSVMALALAPILAVRYAQRARLPVAPILGVAVIGLAFSLPKSAYHTWRGFVAALGPAGPFTAIVVVLLIAAGIALARRRFEPQTATLLGALGAMVLLGILALAHLSLAAGLAALIAPLGTLGDSFVALALITAVEAALWIVGIHGPALLAAVVLPVYLQLQFVNTEAWRQHQPLPHLVVVSTFLFVFPGGAGGTLPLALLLARSRVARLRRIALAALLPSFLNTNEPLLFGLPIVFNPYLAVPFVAAPVLLAATTYAAMATGLVARPYLYVPSTVPFPLGMFLATLDLRSIVLGLVNVALAALVYLPFVRAYERAEAARIAGGEAAA